MSVLAKYSLACLRLNRKRTAVTILGVILSAALICGVFLLGVSFQRLMIEHEVFMSGDWHARFHAVPYAQAAEITGDRAVEAAMLSQPLGSAAYGSRNTARPYLYVTAHDAQSLQNLPIRLISGRLPQAENELLISGVMARDSGLGLEPGSTVTLAYGQRHFAQYDEVVEAWGGEAYVALQDGETFAPAESSTYTVVGVMAPLVDETSMPAAFPALTHLNPERLAATDTVDIAILARSPRSIDRSAPELAARAGLAVTSSPEGQDETEVITYNERLLPWLGGSGRSNYVRFFLAIMVTLTALVVCGSALLISNAFAISINERKRQFGTLASVGATTAQMRRMVLTEAGVIAAIGIPLGILGAIAGVAILVRLTQGIVSELITDAEQGLPLVISLPVIGVTMVLSAVTILLSAWAPALRAARVSPIEAIRQGGEVQERTPSHLRAHPQIRRAFGLEGELALKSLQRDRKKLVTTVLSLMISIVLFVAFNALMLYTATTQGMASQRMNWDLQIDLDYHQSHANGFAERVSQLPEVQQASYIRCFHGEYIPPREVITEAAHAALRELHRLGDEALPLPVDGDTYQFVFKVCSVGPAEFERYAAQLGLDAQQFADPAAPRGILMNHLALRQGGKLYDLDLFDLQPGDTMAATRVTGWASPETPDTEAGTPGSLTFTVGAVTGEPPLGFLGVTLVPEMIVSDAVFDGLQDQMERLGPVALGHMVVKSENPEAAVAAIERLYRATTGGDISYYSMAEFNRSQSLRAMLTNLFFYGFLALITLIGASNIVNTLDTTIKLRRREFAMLRSAGLTPGGLRRMLHYESLCYGLTALLCGLPIGIAVSAAIYLQFGGVSSFAFTLPWGAILACVVGVLAIVFTTMMISGAMIRNDTIVEAVKQENL
jgi:putative ABC transport system permease protein